MIKIALPGLTMKVSAHKTFLEVVLLIVVEEQRGRGLGSRALRAVQQLEHEIRLTAIPGVGKKNALHRFYRRLGFRACGKDCAGHTNFKWTPQGTAKTIS